MGFQVRCVLAALACAIAVTLAGAPAASAEFGFESLDVSLAPAQAGGEVAAGRPVDLTAEFRLNNHQLGTGQFVPDGSMNAFTIGLPPGLIGNPQALPRCRQSDFIGTYVFVLSGPDDGCPASTQVGVAYVTLSTTAHRPEDEREVPTPIFNLEPRHGGEPARLGFVVPLAGLIINVGAQVRSESDFGIDSSVSSLITQGPLVIASRVEIWGVPGDAAHDDYRWATPGCGGYIHAPGSGCDPLPLAENPGLPPKPFLTAPTQCGSPLTATARAESAEEPGRVVHASTVVERDDDGDHETASLPLSSDDTLSGCDAVPFDPLLSVQPTSHRVDSPSGFGATVAVAQHTATGVAQASHVRRSVVTLPEGVSVSPAAAHGLVACSDAQLKLGTREPAACPDGSKVGTVEVDTPLLEDPLEGHVVQRPQLLSETFRVAVVASGAGIHLKIPGVVRPDHGTGQILSIFDNTPQAPFSQLRLRFNGGPSAPLATPMSCGVHTTTGVFTPWSGTPAVTLGSSFGTSWDGAGAPCPAVMPFDPGFAAGSRSPLAGATAPFVVRLARPDRNQELRSLSMEMPAGFAAYLRGVEVCSDAQAAAAACPAGSRIGSVVAGAGPGPSPFYVSGDAYLTEGYKGGAYGIATVVPVKAGPFDLGEVNVRSALHVDRRTAEITVVSDRFPRIVEGVPLRARDVRILVDREDFAVNPTSCEPKRIRTTVNAYQGASAVRTADFRASGCARLGFRPRLAIRLLGRRQTRTGGHPAVRARLRQGPGQAGIERARVIFPKSLALDADNANGLCEFEDGIKDEPTCPDSSIIGRVTAVSPLLNRPLRGPVYFVKNVRIDPNTGNRIRTLPMVVAALRGEIAINIRGTSNSTKGGRLVSTFADIPDAPVSRFNIAIKGGRAGILTVTRTPRGLIDLCRKPRSHIARTPFTAQNGRTHNTRTRLATPCPKANRRARRAQRRRAAAKRRKAAAGQRAARHRR